MNIRDYYAAGTNFQKYNKLINATNKDMGQARANWITKHKGYKMVGAGPRKFYQRKNSPNYNFSNLNSVSIPNVSMIINEQRIMANNITFMQKGKDAMDALNEIISSKGVIEVPFNPDKIISKIEQLLTNYDTEGVGPLYNTKSHQWTAFELLDYMQQHNTLIQDLSNIINIFSTLSLDNNQQAALNKLIIIKDQLLNDIERAKMLNEDEPLPASASYLENLAWASNVLKGRYLEIYGLDFFNKVLPNNLEIVDLASVKGPVLDIFSGALVGKGASLRTDLGIYDKEIAKTIDMKWSINGELKTGSLYDFFQCIKKNKKDTISIPNDDDRYIKNLNNNIFGIQSKSGIGEIHFLRKLKTNNGRKITLSDVINEDNFAAQALKELNLLVTAPYNARLTRTHADYDALFNFCLSRYLTQIIGQENSLMMTRDGIYTIKDWLIEQFAAGRFMHAASRIHIDQLDSSIAIDFGSKIL